MVCLRSRGGLAAIAASIESSAVRAVCSPHAWTCTSNPAASTSRISWCHCSSVNGDPPIESGLSAYGSMSQAVYPPWVPSPMTFTTPTLTSSVEIRLRISVSFATASSTGGDFTLYEATTRNGSFPRFSKSVYRPISAPWSSPIGGTPASKTEVIPAADAFGSHVSSSVCIACGEIGSTALTRLSTASTSST